MGLPAGKAEIHPCGFMPDRKIRIRRQALDDRAAQNDSCTAIQKRIGVELLEAIGLKVAFAAKDKAIKEAQRFAKADIGLSANKSGNTIGHGMDTADPAAYERIRMVAQNISRGRIQTGPAGRDGAGILVIK